MTTKELCAIVVGAIFASFIAPSAIAGVDEWTDARPSGGVATELMRTSDGLYMVSGARIYRSGNDGTTWSLHASLSSSINAIVSPVGQPQVLVAATSANGIMRSTDGGESWAVAEAGATAVDFARHPTAAGTLYAAVPGDGVFVSTNAGASWSALAPPPSLDVVSVVVDPIAPTILYAGTDGDGILRSADAGVSWASVNTGLDSTQRFDELHISPHDDAGGTRSKLLIAGSTTAPTVYRSDDEGANWTAIASDLPPPGSAHGLQDVNFDPDPSFQDGIYAVFSGATDTNSHTFYKSSDPPGGTGGVDWSPRPHPDGAAVGPDMYALYVSPVNLGRVVVGTDRGNYMSFDLGISWEAYNDGFGNTRVCDIALGEALFAASRDGGVLASTDGGESWQMKNAGLASTDVTAVAVDPDNSDRVIAAQADGAFLVSTDAGTTWVPAADGELELVTAIRFAADGTVFALDDGRNGVFKSTDSGQTWTFTGSGMPADAGEGDQLHLAVAGTDADVLYVGTGAGVYRSTNAGASFTAAQGGLAAMMVTALAVDPRDADLVYAAFDDGVSYVSDDGGASWSAAWSGSGAASDARAITIDATDPDRMLVATDAGVFGSIDAGASWYDLSDGLATAGNSSVAVDGLLFDADASGRYVVVADKAVQTYDGAIAVDLVASATASTSSVGVGNTVTLEYALANIAGFDTTGAKLVISVPSAVTASAATIAGGTCSGSSTVTCTVGDLAMGDSAAGTLTLTGASTGTAEITVTGSSDDRENAAADNEEKVTITVSSSGGGENPPPGGGGGSGGGGGNGGLSWLLGVAAMWALRRKGYAM